MSFDKDEIWVGISPDPNEIWCKTCLFRAGRVRAWDHTKSTCDIYEFPGYKPNEVLYKNEPCIHYQEDIEAL